ncbi:hypothetical protein ACGLFO_13400 [Corynebacterium hesseae]|uniref:hypothetical protein n=1 Tax=Corynebacterium hesseae TaxID=2913502 RepID=UPI00373E57EB
MSYPAELDARGLHEWAARTVEELQRRRAEINALNVFPVPAGPEGLRGLAMYFGLGI